MSAVTFRAAHAYSRARDVSAPRPATGAAWKASGWRGAALAILAFIAVAATIVVLRVGVYMATHADQPMIGQIFNLAR